MKTEMEAVLATFALVNFAREGRPIPAEYIDRAERAAKALLAEEEKKMEAA